jgi:hypothetical protein
MERRSTIVTSAVVVALAFTAGCGRGDTPGTREVTEEGCLTAGQGGLVLTRLTRAEAQGTALDPPPEAAATEQASELFMLKGLETELRPHVGKQVRVSGDVAIPAVAEVQQQPSAPGGTTGAPGAPQAGTPGGDGAQPRVTATQSTRLATTEMQVRSVTPLNTSCEAPR